MAKGIPFWNLDRDEKLRTLWGEGKTEEQIADAFLNVVSVFSIRTRISAIRATRNPGCALKRGPEPRKERVREVELPKQRLRVVVADFAPCPYIDPATWPERCGEIVDRRPGKDGARPSQYCRAHEAKVMMSVKCGVTGNAHNARAGMRGG